jgi:hypothetical protein
MIGSHPMATVVTIEELSELKELKTLLPAVRSTAAKRQSSYSPRDQSRGIPALDRMIAQDRLKWILMRIQEIEYKSGLF